jgi:hypothetical protein
MTVEPIRVHDFVWHASMLGKIRRHGGSVRICKEVRDGNPVYIPQAGRSGTHKMVGPDATGRVGSSLFATSERGSLKHLPPGRPSRRRPENTGRL